MCSTHLPPQCNNPQTKEPKLQAAVRIVAEWTDYDQEVKRLYGEFQKEKGSAGSSADGSQSTQTGGLAGHLINCLFHWGLPLSPNER